MREVMVTVEDYLYEFYRKVGQQAGGISTEQVMADALLRLAGDLSEKILRNKDRIKQK